MAYAADAILAPAPDQAAHICAHCGLPVPPARHSRDSRSEAEFCCYGCRLAFELARPGPDAPGERASLSLLGTGHSTLLLRLGLGIFLAMNIMVFSLFFYSQHVYGTDHAASATPAQSAISSLFAYLLMLLTTAVVVLLGVPLASDAVAGWFHPRKRRFNIDANLLILIGVVAAYGLSVAHTLSPGPHGYQLYYDTASMILVLVTIGNYLDSRAKISATSAIESFFSQLPARAFVKCTNGDGYDEVAAEAVRAGDLVRVRPGELIPVDGVIETGSSSINESALTGESRPRDAAPGERALAGTLNLTGLLHVRAAAVGDRRVAAQIHRLLAQARLLQPPIQRLADRVSAVFVPAVVALAIAVFAWNVSIGRTLDGLFNALCVLLISCPCALGLSAPLATWSALSRAARHGILIASGKTLERASHIDQIFFDKTGTLTTDRLTLAQIDVSPDQAHPALTGEQALTLAASIEETSLHPVARSLAAEARQRQLALTPLEHSETLPGLGVHATLSGREYHLGSTRMLAHLQLPAHTNDADQMHVYLIHGGHVIATFTLAEQLRADAADALADLQSLHVRAAVLTGDQPAPAEKLSRRLNLPASAGLLPADKLHHVAQFRQAHPDRCVAMAGDGLNDAPVLAAADVGFVIGNATDLAQHSANVHLLSTRLRDIPLTIALCRHAMRRIRFNLAWSFGYNLIGITLAAFGLLSPLFAASAMIVSSLVIVASSKNAGNLPQLQHAAATRRNTT